jgi:DNA-binding MarR family transcriptional regulator
MVTRPRFDAVIHAPHRLQITAVLAAAGHDVEFGALRDVAGVSDSVLSKQLRTLEDAGYIKIKKATAAGRQRTSAAITPAGRRAFDAHVAELRRLVADPLE